jgi:L-cystine uptake protein TcyP (sodium:dicarboxylate symporter family)
MPTNPLQFVIHELHIANNPFISFLRHVAEELLFEFRIRRSYTPLPLESESES